MDDKNMSHLLDGVGMEYFGGIASIWLMKDIWQERLYEYVGRGNYVANYTMRQGSDAYKKYGSDFTGTIVYTQRERETLENSYQTGNKTYGRVRFNETNCQMSEENILSLKKEGVDITDIEFVFALPMPTENLYIKDAMRKSHRLEIPLPPNITYQDTVMMLQCIYEKCIKANQELCPHEWNDYLAVKLLYCPDTMTEEEKQKSYNANGHIKEDILLAMLGLKTEIMGTLTDEKETEALKILNKQERAKRLLVFKEALQRSGTSFEQMQQKQPQQLALLLAEIIRFHPIRLNTLAHRHAIYLDLDGYLHILLRHVKETSLDLDPIKNKTKLMWNFEDFSYAIKGCVGVIADEYDIKRDGSNRPIYWDGNYCIEFSGDYYALRLDANGRVDTWYRRHNNLLGK